MDHTISKSGKIEECKDGGDNQHTKEKKNIASERANAFELYKYSETKYIILLIVGIINAIVCGGLYPLKFLVVREIFGSMHVENQSKGFADHIRDQAYWFIPLSVGVGITSYIFTL